MKQFIFLFLLFPLLLKAQFQVNGVVKDLDTKKPLPFASLKTNIGFFAITDVDGKFSFNASLQTETLTFQYIGYVQKTISINEGNKNSTIYLSPKIDALKEVVIFNDATAKNIINKVIALKEQNDPKKKLSSFQFKSYNKLLVTANPDSIIGKIDTTFISKSGKVKIDSSDFKFKKIISKQHLFLTEKVSLFQYDKPHLKETIIGAKMAGFKEPLYEILGFNLQSFSIYDNNYELFETKYQSPISKLAAKEYRYKIIDTIAIESRPTIIIYFKNKTSPNGLEGLLYIDAENFAVAKAVMRIRGVLDISGIHEFTYLPKENIWFPIQKNFKILKGKSKEPTTILGGRIKFSGEDDESDNKKAASDFTYFSSDVRVYDLEINSPLKIKKSSVTIEATENANKRDNAFWATNRNDPLDSRSERTYHVLDSIGNKEKIDRKIKFGRKIINGYIPFGPVDLDLRYILSYNNFEGFRLGIGGVTNDIFSKIIRIEGYYGFGLKDENIKYNFGAAFRVGNFSNTWIGGAYTDDIREIASTSFAIDKRVFKLYDNRPINLSTFYNYKNWRGFIETKIIPKTESIWQVTHSDIIPLFNYTFNYLGQSYNAFSISTGMVSLQCNPFSDYMQTPNGKIEFEKRYPRFTFQFTKSLPKFLANDFDFGKIDARIEYEKKYLDGQKSSVLLQGGYSFGALPLTHLYNSSPNNLTKDNILERITITGKNSFETMYFNEFFSSEYVMLHIKHGLKRFKIIKKIKPSVFLVTRMAWGNMKNSDRHNGIEFKTLNKGFFESGLEINQIYKGFGFTGFYRYGPNQLPRFDDNLAVKLSFIFDIGF